MNFRVYILAICTVIVGLVELIVGGVLPIIAEDLDITISTAGQLITIFALVYAISGPVLLSLTAKVERKKLYLISLVVFFVGNILTFLSPNFAFVVTARVITAMSAALVIVLSLTITARIVEPAYRVKALGFIYMGISSALVLGVPIGIVITNVFGWRIVFLGIASLTLVAMALIHTFLEKTQPENVQPLLAQIKALGNIKAAGAHLATVFILAGHYTLYAYFAPFLETTLNLSQYWISICYFLFGLAAVSGGALGGTIATRIGSERSLLLFISIFAVVLFILPYTTFSFPLFLVMMMVWGVLSWGHSPPTQDYLIQIDPENSDIHQSLNNSAIQIGIALGSALGGIVLNYNESVTSTAGYGSIIIVIAFIFASVSVSLPYIHSQRETSQ